jgi:hypothetical protein
MTSFFLRPARIVLVAGLIAAGGSVANAGNFGGNLNIRTSAQNAPQTVFAGRSSNAGLGTSTTAPPYSYGRPGPRVHEFDRNTQFNGMTDTSATGKLPK